MISRVWILHEGRELLKVSVNGIANGDVEGESRNAIEMALSALIEAGFHDDHIVRSRLYARDADVRRRASDLRLAVLGGPRRAASSSYIDPERLPAGSSISIDLVAQRVHRAEVAKQVAEYDPIIAPPKYVALDGMVFLSGNTDTASEFELQLANIRAKIDASLAAAGTGWSRLFEFTAHVSKTIGPRRAARGFATYFPEVPSVTISSVIGYSAPEKLVEVEVAASV